MSKIGVASKISEIIRENEFYIKKKYGQNFLIDQNILKKIVNEANLDQNTLVVEIGPGFGSLTEHLVKNSKHVLAYEIDEDFVKHLKTSFEKHSFTLINDDVLKRDMDKDIEELGMEFRQIVMVANLPYYITTPVIMKVLEQTKSINRMIVMMQYEVAKRMTSKPDTKDYNSLSIAIQYRASTKYLFKVPNTVFIPKPKVDSAIISLDIYKKSPFLVEDESFFFEIVKTSFKQRRKTLYNNLKGLECISTKDIKNEINNLGLSETVRAEALDLNTFIDLSKRLKKYMI